MMITITLMEQVEVALLMLLAAFLSGIIGLDRERLEKAAGVRTHMLVGVGACLFTALSRLGFGSGADSARVAAKVVEGVGFLGAGMIWRSKSHVHDLTTAASIWLTAAIGMTVGAGAWFLAIAGTIAVWVILVILRHLPVRHTNLAHKKNGKANKVLIEPTPVQDVVKTEMQPN